MKIKSAFKEYSVAFCRDLSLLQDLAAAKDTFFVLDRTVYELYKDRLPDLPKDRFFLLEAVEEKKNMAAMLAICERMTEMSAKRNSHLVSLGGGITQDVTGFVATALYRGIRWTFFPTTLLAACDSCIGGKSSLNYKGFKNLLGSFYPPDGGHRRHGARYGGDSCARLREAAAVCANVARLQARFHRGGRV